jgi:hypothetical protein
MAKYIRTLTVFYDTEISYKEIPLFRGAVLNSLGDKANVLYHNHTGEKSFRYSYPLIQYKRLNGKAAITCVEEGADIIGQFLSEGMNSLILGDRIVESRILRVVPSRMAVQLWKISFTYDLKRWLPLNGRNYHLYQLAENEQEKKEILEKVLRGNLLSMLKGLNIFVEEELTVRIVFLDKSHIIYNKGIALMSFNIKFESNLSIPNNIGIGKNASIGYGIIHQEQKDKNQE